MGVYLLARGILLVATAVVAHGTYGGRFLAPASSWDGAWYLRVAASGYPSGSPTDHGHLTYAAGAFQPVLPVLIRTTSFLLGWSLPAAALVVSILGGAMTVLATWRLAAAVTDARSAYWGAVLFCVFPGMGIAWGLVYAEAVALGLAALCLMFLVRKRWMYAGIFGFLATLTSPLAFPLTLAAAVGGAQALRGRARVRQIAPLGLVPLGFVAFAVGIGLRHHDLLYWWHLQHAAWNQSFDFGRSLVRTIANPASGAITGPGWLSLLGAVAVVGMALCVWRAHLPATLWVYFAGVLLLLACSTTLGFKPRLLAWPALVGLIGVAMCLRPVARWALAVASAVLMVAVFVAYSTVGNVMAQP
jgi:hypothetical protein